MLAAEALKDIISPNESRQITPEFILEIVSIAKHIKMNTSSNVPPSESHATPV